jgi:hypothetical protein
MRYLSLLFAFFAAARFVDAGPYLGLFEYYEYEAYSPWDPSCGESVGSHTIEVTEDGTMSLDLYHQEDGCWNADYGYTAYHDYSTWYPDDLSFYRRLGWFGGTYVDQWGTPGSPPTYYWEICKNYTTTFPCDRILEGCQD